MSSLVSIIIPVHETPQNLLARCLESVLSQTYGELEVIICDDGSSSGCAAAIDTLAARDERCRVLHLLHGGVSAARNAGIAAAQGEWIAFADADDEVLPVFVEEALSIAVQEEADFVAGARERVWPGRDGDADVVAIDRVSAPYVIVDGSLLNDFRVSMVAFLDSANPAVPHIPSRGPCCKLFRRSLMEGACFDEGVAQGEDALFIFRYLEHCSRAVQVGNVWYRYYQYAGSGLHGLHLEKRKLGLEIIRALQVGPQFENARMALECHLAQGGALAALRSSDGLKGVHMAASLLRDFSQDGCFEHLDLGEFRVSKKHRFLLLSCRYRRYFFAATLLAAKDRLEGRRSGVL